MTRNKVLEMASLACLKELYSKVQPAVTWEDFTGQNKMYSNQYKLWEKTKDLDPNYIGKTRLECIGPAPYEFYYLPRDVMSEICDSYVHAYKINNQQELLDTIKTLKNYCKKPIVDKYINDWTDETGFHHPGYRSYDHPDNLKKQLIDLIPDSGFDKSAIAESVQSKFFEFLDMAGNFYNWNGDLNAFNTAVYLGPSPCSNKETVIKNWKLYRNKDILIDDSLYIEDEED